MATGPFAWPLGPRGYYIVDRDREVLRCDGPSSNVRPWAASFGSVDSGQDRGLLPLSGGDDTRKDTFQVLFRRFASWTWFHHVNVMWKPQAAFSGGENLTIDTNSDGVPMM